MFRTLGERANLNSMARPQNDGQPVATKRAIYLNLDMPLLLIVVTLLVVGIVMVYSASYDFSLQMYGDPSLIFNRQLIWLLFGIVVAIATLFVDYHFLKRVAVVMVAVTLVLLAAVLLSGEIRNGAARTLWGGSIQPSELAKLVTVIYLSVWLYSKRDQISDIMFGMIPLAVILGWIGAFIYLQPDLSAVLTIFILGGMMFFLAGGELKQFTFMVVVALIAGWIIVQFNPTGSNRVGSYLAGLKDPTQASYHVRRSMEAFVEGEWLGTGIGRGETKLLGLPVPQTDSIFAVIGEETGFLGSAGLVALYIFLVWRGLKIAQRAPDDLGALLAGGLSLWLGLEAFINMAVMVNLVPFAGNALPFISAGGSNMAVSMIAIGILFNIARQSDPNATGEGRSLSAVVDLRWRDRRRRVSRPRRSSGLEGGR